ncbi:ectoine/hydroxyectoine ABC transporter substrate-binding protein EhuB [Rhodoligotrophos defluvii]|uniref:ectoine/hydroxyectoine ABC transporter substrate-binding protein EhuB n=1 Tax=Rhodoligotrophos defluvii TaxID=2561934 RepID=UPI0010CA0846|nr:ectoine/hydroxyectoine ABC transporter substrate-binding protein EhuB [Rhodoligotrophos defluvii]
MSVTRRHLLGASLSLASALVLPSLARAETTLERIKRTGKVSVGIANERPYGFVDTNGKLVGAVPDLIQAALEPHGVKEMQAEIVEFSAMIPGLNANRFDIIGAGMYITPPRCQAIIFTNPVTRAGYGFVALKGNPKGVHSVADVVKNPDVIVGTQNGSAQVGELEQAGVPKDRVVLYANATEALAGLKANRSDVIYFPGLELGDLLKTANDPAVERVEPFHQMVGPDGKPQYGYSAMGLRKADTDLKQVLDAEIAKMLASGKLLEIIAKYGYGKDELPTAEDTAERLCKAA